jgi:uncharacterized membrane protein YvbJ
MMAVKIKQIRWFICSVCTYEVLEDAVVCTKCGSVFDTKDNQVDSEQ